MPVMVKDEKYITEKLKTKFKVNVIVRESDMHMSKQFSSIINRDNTKEKRKKIVLKESSIL